MPKVIVIGGGVAGLTAAHELAQRGFEVDVYEAREAWGGKARSQPVPGSGTNGRKDLPGEHGFRFYPRFYTHVIDVMQRIPCAGQPGRFVAEHLRPTTESAIALIDQDSWHRFHRRKIDKPYDVLQALELFFQELDFDGADISLFCLKILQFLSTCQERRDAEYDDLSWWQFLRGDGYSPKFQRQLRAVPRTMVAMDPKAGSARTIGAISMQLIVDYASAGVNNDRTMGGPTSEMWLDHWVHHLTEGLGVRLHPNQRCTALDVSGGRITGVRFEGAAGAVTADQYVLAVPLEIAADLITPEMGELDEQLEQLRIADCAALTSWMVGIQYFLYEDVPLVRGHTFYPDSPWALTSISQPQFWRERGLFRTKYGDGSVGGIISVDISDWDTPGIHVAKTAKQCTKDEVAKEVWWQLKAALNGRTAAEQFLTDDLLHSWHLDADLDYSGGCPPVNRSPLLVHPPGAWRLRPHAQTQIPNLCLAGDYVKTNTDLASMEGACEAGKRATNAILRRTGSTEPECEIYPLEEPPLYEPMKNLDRALFERGKPHLFQLMGIDRAFQAADLFRRFSAFTGISAIDDWLDQIRVTEVIDGLLARLGIDAT